MPTRQRYRIRRVNDGRIRTYSAYSERGALKALLADSKVRPRLENREEVEIRPVDEDGDWQLFRIYR